jgi:hypothetical protein
MDAGGIKGEYSGPTAQKISLRLANAPDKKNLDALLNGSPLKVTTHDGWISLILPATKSDKPCRFEITQNQ